MTWRHNEMSHRDPPSDKSQQPIIAGAVASRVSSECRDLSEAVHLYRIMNTALSRNCHTVIDENFAFLGTCDTERGWFSRTVILKVFFLPLDLEVLRPVERTCSSGVGIAQLEVSPGYPPTDIFVPETVGACFQINLKCVEQHSVNFQSIFNCRPKFSAIHQPEIDCAPLFSILSFENQNGKI